MDDGRTRFLWVMAVESGTAGFNLLMDENGTLTQVNDELIVSRVVDSLVPQLYEYSAQVSE